MSAKPRPDDFSVAPSLLRRLASALYETILLIGVSAVFVLLPQTLYAMARQMPSPAWLIQLHLLIVLGLYFSWFWSHGGQTLAMKTWKIRLLDHAGKPVSLPRALLRYLLCWPSVLLLGAGWLWALFHREHQFLHDQLARTRLVMVSVDPPTTSSPRPSAKTGHSA